LVLSAEGKQLEKPERVGWIEIKELNRKPIKLPKEHVLMNFLFGFLSFIGKVKYFRKIDIFFVSNK
jgi:hypothetical protein